MEDGKTNLFEDCGNIFVIRWDGFIAFVFFLDEGDVLEDLGVGEDRGLGFDDLRKEVHQQWNTRIWCGFVIAYLHLKN